MIRLACAAAITLGVVTIVVLFQLWRIPEGILIAGLTLVVAAEALGIG